MTGEIEAVVIVGFLIIFVLTAIFLCWFFYKDSSRADFKSPFEIWIGYRREKLLVDKLQLQMKLKRGVFVENLNVDDIDLDSASLGELIQIRNSIDNLVGQRDKVKDQISSRSRQN